MGLDAVYAHAPSLGDPLAWVQQVVPAGVEAEEVAVYGAVHSRQKPQRLGGTRTIASSGNSARGRMA